MVEYLAIAFPHDSGGWVTVLPDFVGVTGRAEDARQAIQRATRVRWHEVKRCNRYC